MALTDKLTAIADAIRDKTGGTDALTLDEMPGEIEAIQTGGDTSIEDSLVEGTLSSYSNTRVTSIATNAFRGRSEILAVSFPNVETIGGSSFQDCSNLSEVYFPKVTSVGKSVFYNTGIKTIHLPELMQTSSNMFQYSKIEIITDASLPAITSLIGDYCFGNCSALRYFQHSLRNYYASRCFQSSSALEKVDIHATGLTYHCFSGCSALSTLILRQTDAICDWSNTNALTNTPIVKGTGFVYVPRALLEEYRQATNWSSLLPEQFRAIEDYPEICEVGV